MVKGSHPHVAILKGTLEADGQACHTSWRGPAPSTRGVRSAHGFQGVLLGGYGRCFTLRIMSTVAAHSTVPHLCPPRHGLHNCVCSMASQGKGLFSAGLLCG